MAGASLAQRSMAGPSFPPRSFPGALAGNSTGNSSGRFAETPRSSAGSNPEIRHHHHDDRVHRHSDTRVPLQPGTIVGNYAIVSRLGHGGFGITYRARNTQDGSTVVIKEHFPEGLATREPGSDLITSSTPETDRRLHATLVEFMDEVSILMGLAHPGIVPIIAGFEANGTAYYVMPFVDGDPLKLPDQATLDRSRKAIEARQRKKELHYLLYTLEYLEQHNIIHRDIKPENILLNADGRPILLDFGSARQMQRGKVFTNIFTPDFCAPEQSRALTDSSMSEQIGPWTDLYSLGATYYYLITRLLPPKADLRAIATPDPYKPLAGRPDLEELYGSNFLQAIDRALVLDPEERWRSASAWRTSIEDGIMPPAPSLVKRMRLVSGAAIAILLLCGGFSFWALQERNQAIKIYKNSLRFTEGMLYGFNDELADIPGSTQLQQQMGVNLKNYLHSMEQLRIAHDAKLQQAIASAWLNLGDTSVQQGDLPAATDAYRCAMSLLANLIEHDPDNRRYRYELAQAELSRAEIARRRNNTDKARGLISKALPALRKLCREAPSNPDYRCALGRAIGFVAALANDAGDDDLRKKALDEMVALYRKLVADYPRHEEARKGLAYALQYSSSQAMDQQDYATALHMLNEEKEIFSSLSSASPYRLSFKMGIATAYFNIGAMYRQMAAGTDHDEAVDSCNDSAMEAFAQCLAIVHELESMDKHNADYPALAGEAMAHVIDIHLRRKEPNIAEAYSKELLFSADRLLKTAPHNAYYAKLKAAAMRGLAMAHSQSDKAKGSATKEFAEYREIASKLLEKTPNSNQMLSLYADALTTSAIHAQSVGDSGNSQQWFDKSIHILNSLIRKNPNNPAYAIQLKKNQERLDALKRPA